MKMDVRTSVALCLLAVTESATAQNVPQEQTAPAPQQGSPPTPHPWQSSPPAPNMQPPPPQATTPATSPPQSPPPPQYQYQYTPPPGSPPPQHFDSSRWSHSETTYYEGNNGFKYHPFRFHIDGGGTLAKGANSSQLDNGWNAGFGFSWFPTSHLPLGVRVDGTYNEFSMRMPLLNQAAATYGTQIDDGTEKVWGGDIDLELDSYFSPHVRMYLLAGGGWYRQQNIYRQTNYYPGLYCGWWSCSAGYYAADSVVGHTQGKWEFARNAGIGLEFAMSPSASFFVEARYMRIGPNNAHSDFLPIRAGLRF